jgi:hypothetical protein
VLNEVEGHSAIPDDLCHRAEVARVGREDLDVMPAISHAGREVEGVELAAPQLELGDAYQDAAQVAASRWVLDPATRRLVIP